MVSANLSENLEGKHQIFWFHTSSIFWNSCFHATLFKYLNIDYISILCHFYKLQKSISVILEKKIYLMLKDNGIIL